MTRLFARCETDAALREQLFAKGTGRLLYEVLDDLFDYCFPILDKIGHKLDSIEDDMFEGYAEDVVRDISNAKQEIISYRKVMKPGRSTLRVLERRVDKFLPEELDLYFDDIVDAAERIWDQLDNYKEVVDGLESTNESVISHRQNDVLRVLTIFSVVLLPLTLISGIFGMNVDFPGFDSPRRLLGDRRADGRRDRRHGRLLPAQALALARRAWQRRGVGAQAWVARTARTSFTQRQPGAERGLQCPCGLCGEVEQSWTSRRPVNVRRQNVWASLLASIASSPRDSHTWTK